MHDLADKYENPDAQYKLAILYFKRNDPAAWFYLKQSAKQLVESQIVLAETYAKNGDRFLAKHILLDVIPQQNFMSITAYFPLAEIYREDTDYVSSVKYLRRGATAGSGHCCFALAQYYIDGCLDKCGNVVIEPDLSTAIYLPKKRGSCEWKNFECFRALGSSHESKNNSCFDIKEALYWYAEYINHTSVESDDLKTLFYSTDYGVETNEWFGEILRNAGFPTICELARKVDKYYKRCVANEIPFFTMF